MPDIKKITGVSDDAVKAKTGKDWAGWFAVLDKAGAKKMPHRDIAELLHAKYKVPAWWCQMVTVGYERARGLRKMHQKAGGFSASCSRTIAAPVGALFRAWQDPARRRRWLAEKFTLRKATRNKTLRITWPDATNVEVYFVPKGRAKTQIAVQHDKLPNAAAVTKRKAFWSARFAKLSALVGV